MQLLGQHPLAFVDAHKQLRTHWKGCSLRRLPAASLLPQSWGDDRHNAVVMLSYRYEHFISSVYCVLPGKIWLSKCCRNSRVVFEVGRLSIRPVCIQDNPSKYFSASLNSFCLCLESGTQFGTCRPFLGRISPSLACLLQSDRHDIAVLKLVAKGTAFPLISCIPQPTSV
jgi:hypothetical protein